MSAKPRVHAVLSFLEARTKRNVADSDATLIFNTGALSGGSLLTKRFALKQGKPWWVLQIDTNGAFP